MTRPLAVLTLILLAALPLAADSARATEYGGNSACRAMRNNTLGAPFPAEPNRDDTRKAFAMSGGETMPLGPTPYGRKLYGEAFLLLQKIDTDGTNAVAALAPDTPRIDLVIDRQVANLTVARLMLALFYEQGRLGRPDPAQAAAYYERAFATAFTDDRGCTHVAQIPDDTRKRYVALLVYDLRTHDARAKALALLKTGGPKFASAFYLLGKNMLPPQKYEFFETDLDAMAEEVRHPPPTETELYFALAGHIALWVVSVTVTFFAAIGLFRYIRRRA